MSESRRRHSGTIPAAFGSLTKLQGLELGFNELPNPQNNHSQIVIL